MTMIPTAADAASTNEHQDYHRLSSPPLSPASLSYRNDCIGTSLLNYIQTPSKEDHGSVGRKRRRKHDDHGDDDIDSVDLNINTNAIQEDEASFDSGHQRGQNRPNNNHDHQHILEHDKEATEVDIAPQFVPCLLLDGGDHQINRSNNHTKNDHMLQLQRQRQHRQCMWLQGPPKSGKSSLAMNFAYSIAAAASTDTLSYAATASTLTQTNSSSLVAKISREKIFKHHRVSCVVYMPKNTDNDRGGLNINRHESENLFPLFCERRKPPSRNSTMLGTASIGCNTYQNVNHGNDNDIHNYWDPTVLRRIRIHRVQSVREMLEDMTSMLGKPIEEQPIGGALVIDGIDQIILNDAKLKHNAKTKNTFEANKNNSNSYYHTKNGCSNFDGYNDYTKRTKIEMYIVNIAKSTADTMTKRYGSYTSLLVTKMMTSSSSSLASPSVISGSSHDGGTAGVPVWVSNVMDATVTLQDRSTLLLPTIMGTTGSTLINHINAIDNDKTGSKQVKEWIATITNCSGTHGRKTSIVYGIDTCDRDGDFREQNRKHDDVGGAFSLTCLAEERIVWSCSPHRQSAEK